MESDAPASIEAAAEWLRKRFDADASRGVRLSYQLELSGAGGGELALRIEGGSLEARRGRLEAPDVVLRLAASDYYGILGGRENSELLFMAGRIGIQGDPALAVRLRTFFRRRA
jgi:hypothetical protein